MLSSKPVSGFIKSAMAKDILMLLNYLGIDGPIHLIGHDIDGMIAYAFASRYPSRVMSVVRGKCSLPETAVY